MGCSGSSCSLTVASLRSKVGWLFLAVSFPGLSWVSSSLLALVLSHPPAHDLVLRPSEASAFGSDCFVFLQGKSCLR